MKMIVGNKGHVVAAIYTAKCKTASLMVGLTFALFYNMPFELIGIGFSDVMLIIAAIFAIVSAFQYYVMASKYIDAK
jgi:phosphatidylglycerophosphate synthase